MYFFQLPFATWFFGPKIAAAHVGDADASKDTPAPLHFSLHLILLFPSKAAAHRSAVQRSLATCSQRYNVRSMHHTFLPSTLSFHSHFNHLLASLLAAIAIALHCI
jgi:hypothetical protein